MLRWKQPFVASTLSVLLLAHAGHATVAPPHSPSDGAPVRLGGGQSLPLAALVGTVSGALINATSVPLSDAGVYAYRVTDLTLHKAQTDRQGSFSFAVLPAGVYKIIAHKTGFLPAVVLVTRTAASAFQELQLELAPDQEGSDQDGLVETDFWQIRQRIPADVLRQIRVADLLTQAPSPVEDFARPWPSTFSAQVHALTGSGEFGGMADASMVGGHVDLSGQVGTLDVGIVGNFRSLQRAETLSNLGHAQSLALSLRNRDESEFRVSGQQGSLDGLPTPVDLEKYGIGWSSDLGAGRTEISASYIEEANYYRDPRLDFFRLPTSSRTVDIEGQYSHTFSERTGLLTGVRYRDRAADAQGGLLSRDLLSTERVEVFGLGDLSVGQALSVQYGLFTTHHDGSVAFTPQAGLTVELPNDWKAETTVRKRVYQTTESWISDFQPAHHGRQFECSTADKDCYRVNLSGRLGAKSSLEIGALHRTFADTLRLYFSEDLFDELDSLFFVEGDELPELHLAFSRRLAPRVMTRFESNIASGGGGIIAGSSRPLENKVQYLVTSMDTQFEGTQTGVLLSFHSLEQRFLTSEGVDAFHPVARQRLQLLVTQGLSRVMGLSPDLDIVLDMQVSRSDDQLVSASRDLQSRVLGGIALRF